MMQISGLGMVKKNLINFFSFPKYMHDTSNPEFEKAADSGKIVQFLTCSKLLDP